MRRHQYNRCPSTRAAARIVARARPTPRTVLLTGFEPFGGERRNPSWDAVRALRGVRIGGAEIVVARLPTAFDEACTRLRKAWQRHRPALTLLVGQAGGRPAISLERVAVNLIDARIPDNTGAQPIDRPVVASGPAAYFAPLPLKAMLQAARARGIPCELSLTAGSFVCNAVFYALCHELAQSASAARGGFVHVPYAPSQARAMPGMPSMAIETVVEALREFVRVGLRADPGAAGPAEGREH